MPGEAGGRLAGSMNRHHQQFINIKYRRVTMHTTDTINAQPQLIALGKLEKSPRNARRTVAKGASEELKASILAHGLMQNLVVTDAGDGTYRVIAGARRRPITSAASPASSCSAWVVKSSAIHGQRRGTAARRASWPPSSNGPSPS